MLSPKKARPMRTPYRPPTSSSPLHASTLCAWPMWCSAVYAPIISSEIQVSPWTVAHWRITSPKAASVVQCRPLPRRKRRKRLLGLRSVKGKMARGSGQCHWIRPSPSAMGKNPPRYAISSSCGVSTGALSVQSMLFGLHHALRQARITHPDLYDVQAGAKLREQVVLDPHAGIGMRLQSGNGGPDRTAQEVMNL